MVDRDGEDGGWEGGVGEVCFLGAAAVGVEGSREVLKSEVNTCSYITPSLEENGKR